MTIPEAGNANISGDGLYRYWLMRQVVPGNCSTVLFVMLNPSTADADRDDPTVRRCARFVRDRGFGRLEVCNLFALRATDPRALRAAADPVGPDNPAWLTVRAYSADLVVAAWGRHGELNGQGREVTELLRDRSMWRFGGELLKNGMPRHPPVRQGGLEADSVEVTGVEWRIGRCLLCGAMVVLYRVDDEGFLVTDPGGTKQVGRIRVTEVHVCKERRPA